MSSVCKPREAYVRASIMVNGREVCAGLEWQYGEVMLWLRGKLLKEMNEIAELGFAWFGSQPIPDDWLALRIEEVVKTEWPGRAYFIEVGVDEEWVQIYQPWSRSEEAR